jgi:PAS domain S-box-containing protein
VLLSGWKRSLSRDAKLLIAGILILSLFHHLSDFLQWSGIYDKLDAIEDYPGMLQPLLWLFLLYAMIKQVAFKDLHSSEERLRRVVENMPVMMIAFDGDWNFALWNSECEHVTGYTPEEMIDNPHAMGTLFPDPKYLRYVKKTYKEFKNDIRDQEWKITCKDGTVKTIIWSDISRRFPIAGWSMWSIGIDVSSRVNTEKALRESDEKYRALIEQSGDAIYLLTDSKYELINQQFAKLFKISVDEALAPDFDLMTLIAPQSRELITERAAMAKRGERLSSHCEFTGLTKDGKEIEIEASVSHLIRDGKLTTQGVLHDITERKQADRATCRGISNSPTAKCWNTLAMRRPISITDLAFSICFITMSGARPGTGSSNCSRARKLAKQNIEVVAPMTATSLFPFTPLSSPNMAMSPSLFPFTLLSSPNMAMSPASAVSLSTLLIANKPRRDCRNWQRIPSQIPIRC